MRPALMLATAILAFSAVADAQTPSGPAITRCALGSKSRTEANASISRSHPFFS